MIYKTITSDELRSLRSFDYPCLVGELTRDTYVESKHRAVFDDLAVDIQKNGISTPLRVVNGYLVDGHHRAVVALELGIDLIPIQYEGVL